LPTAARRCRLWSRCRFLALLALAAVAARAALVDLSAPLTEVAASYDGAQVVCRVFDPAQGREFTNTTSAPSLFAFQNRGGVVSWTSGQTVYVRTYDPARTNWVEFNQPVAQVLDVRNHRGLVAWSAVGQVGFVVYDRTRQSWLADKVNLTPSDLRCVDGVVSWTSGNSVFLRTYDPALGRWQADDNAFGATFDLSNTNGVVAWSTAGTVRVREYDALRQRWVRDDTATPGALTLLDDSGLVAWGNGPQLRARLFHPHAGQWLGTTVAPASGFVILMGITNATATWSDGFLVSHLGYNFAASNWHAQPTRPLAGFAASAASGRAPLTVYFTDVSVAGLAYAWNFGDGETSSARSPGHTFRTPGRFTVTQTVTGAGGLTVSYTTNILTDLDPPVGSVVINDGAAFTTNRVVTLTLAATDNSGTVARMRFSNDGATWSAWEPFAPTKVWELPAGVTTRTVRAQFEDPFGNISAPVSDSILLDTTPPPTARLALSETNLTERTANLTFAVNLDYPMSREVRVDYLTRELTATAGQDFEAAAGTLIFLPGTTNRVLTVRILDDTRVELDEQFQVVLTNGVDTVPGSPLTVTLLDNDPPTVRFATERFSAPEDAGPALLSVVLSAASGRPVSVAWAATNGTATAGLDYVASTGVLEFAPGQTQQNLALPLLDDALDEPTETIEVRLFNPTNAVLTAPTLAVLDLLDNEPPTVNFSAAADTVSEGAGSFTATVTLTKPSTQTILVDYATAGGTATPGQDYVAAAGTLIFSPGQTQRTFVVTLLNDSQVEPAETLELELSGFVNVLPGERMRATLSLLDDDSPLELVAAAYSPDSGFRLRVSGPAGGLVRLEASPDLRSWTELATLENPTGTVEFTDPASPGAAARFYRARRLP
jgi:PKD repeat protein